MSYRGLGAAIQDAVAFVMAAISLDNGIGFKEFPCHYDHLGEEWMAEYGRRR